MYQEGQTARVENIILHRSSRRAELLLTPC
jgi:hypothetical protein